MATLRARYSDSTDTSLNAANLLPDIGGPPLSKKPNSAPTPDSPPSRSARILHPNPHQHLLLGGSTTTTRALTPPVLHFPTSVKVTVEPDELYYSDDEGGQLALWNSIHHNTIDSDRPSPDYHPYSNLAFSSSSSSSSSSSPTTSRSFPLSFTSKTTTLKKRKGVKMSLQHHQDVLVPRPWSKGRQVLCDTLIEDKDLRARDQSGILIDANTRYYQHHHSQEDDGGKAKEELRGQHDSSASAFSPWRPSGYSNSASTGSTCTSTNKKDVFGCSTYLSSPPSSSRNIHTNNKKKGLKRDSSKNKSTVVHTVRRSLYQRAMLRASHDQSLGQRRKTEENLSKKKVERKSSVPTIQEFDLPKKLNRSTNNRISNSSNGGNARLHRSIENTIGAGSTVTSSSSSSSSQKGSASISNILYSSQPLRTASVRVVSAGMHDGYVDSPLTAACVLQYLTCCLLHFIFFFFLLL